MAKFKNSNLQFKDNKKIVFGDSDDVNLYFDGSELKLDTTVSGIPITFNFGSFTISGSGDIYCHDLFTAASGIYLGDSHLSYDGESLEVSSSMKTQGNLLGNYNDDTREPTGFVEQLGRWWPAPPTSSISFDDSTRTFTISGSEFLYYDQGKRYKVKGSESVQIGDISGLWHIYFDGSELKAFRQSGQPYDIAVKPYVALIYWSSTAGKALHILDERHSAVMDAATQYYIDMVHGLGLDLWSGFYLNIGMDDGYPYWYVEPTYSGTGDSDSDAQIGISAGYVHNSDIRLLVTTSGAFANQEEAPYHYTQNITFPAEIPIYYGDGDTSNGFDVLKKRTATTFPVYDGVGTGRIGYGKYTNTASGTVYSIEEVPNGHYVIYWLFLHPDMLDPVIIWPDNFEYATLEEAESQLMDEYRRLPNIETRWKLLYKLIFQTDDSYTNSVKARLVSSTDYRTIPYAYARAPTPHKSWSYLDYETSGHIGFMSLDTDQTAGGEKTFINTIHHADDILPTVSGTSSIGGEELPYTQIYLADQATSDTYSITIVSGTLVATMV